MADATVNDNPVPSIENGAPAPASAADDTKTTTANSVSSTAKAVTNGPVVQSVKKEATKTSDEFSNLANARTTPANPAATGQQLTHYHSFFTTLLSWQNPRASGIAYLSIVLFIFAARYLHILRYAFKLTWMTLGVTVLAEIAGKTILSTGLTSQFRPKKYYTLSKETLNSLIGDVHELINFFVIESQRILFAENVFVSGAAFVASFVSYYLIRIVPFWGLTLIGTSVLFLVPLVYKTNKEFIDAHLNKAAEIATQQSEQVRKLASQQAALATQTTRQYVGDYSAKASEMISRARSVSPAASAKPAKSGPIGGKENVPIPLKKEDFPAAPKEAFKPAPVKEDEPLIAA